MTYLPTKGDTLIRWFLRGVASTQQALVDALNAGGLYWDPAVQYGQTGTVFLHVLLETSNAGIAAFARVFQSTGTGSPQAIGTAVTTASLTPAHLTLDLSAVFAHGGTAAAGVYDLQVYLASYDRTTFAVCSGAWLEITR